MSKPLVIVESPTKRDTIRRFLGSGYLVEASVGHIRDLPESAKDVPEAARKAGFGDIAVNVGDDFRPYYVVPDKKKAQVAALKALLKEASAVFLATDEDREGESISWHLREVLKPKVPVRRMVFHEITPEAIRDALSHPRDIDENLVSAQETRRVVDRLYGYAVSPVLWRKIRGAKSAGRVQSPAVRLLVQRERERMAFRSSTWWDVEGSFQARAGGLGATLSEVGGRRVAKGRDFDETTGTLSNAKLLHLDEAGATALVKRLEGRTGKVAAVESRPWKDRAAPPFTTSTLQQEANRKLRWTAAHTMRVAQTLYESGWITYMRTDSVALSDQALKAARTLIEAQYGPAYLPPAPRRYKASSKNAQEAHEAIRPAGTAFRTIEHARSELAPDEARLYELIWKRTVASQMEDARGQSLTVVIDVDDAKFVATGRTIEFPGFQRAYVEGSDDPDAELAERERLLPDVKVGDPVTAKELTAKGHVTQPPARLTEATLVKELERLGIGRPSTYASIIKLILDRGYAFKKSNALVPTYTAFLLTGFMESQLGELVDYDFTARIEDDLDRIALGRANRIDILKAFYLGEVGLQKRLEVALAADASDIYRLPIRGVPADSALHVRVGPYGPFATDGTSTVNIPEDMPPDEVTFEWVQVQLATKAAGPRVIGTSPDGQPVFAMKGRFGPYIQLGEAKEGEKPTRASLLPGMNLDTVDIDTAVKLLSLPRKLGADPGNGEEIVATVGRFGPYVKRGTESRSLPPGVSPLEVTLTEAVALFAQPARRARASIEPLRTLGNDPEGREVRLLKGRFGPYVTDGVANATLPKGRQVESLELPEALELLARKHAAGPSTKKPVRRGARKPAAADLGVKKVVGAGKSATAKKAKAKAADKAPATTKSAAKAKKPAATDKTPATTKPAAKAKKKPAAAKAKAPAKKAASRRPTAEVEA